MKRTQLRARGKSDTSVLKDEIQKLVRDIVIARDGGCILRKTRYCVGEVGFSVLQADHLITRANSATFADTRLIVCLCRPCHAWKSLGGNLRKAQYDDMVKKLLSPERVKLWEQCERDSWRPQRMGAYDWKIEIIALKKQLSEMKVDK